MPHGAPDGYQYQLQGGKDILADLGELAARIDAHDVWDRRGQVVWHDRFESGLSAWRVGGGGTGNTIYVTAVDTEFGPYALVLVAGSDAGKNAQVFKYFPVPEINKWGLELGLALTTTFNYFSISLSRTHDEVKQQAYVIIDHDLGAIRIIEAGGGYITLGTIGDPVGSYKLYQQIKVVADFDTKKYVRVLYNDTEYDVSAYDLYESPDLDIDNQKTVLNIAGRTGSNDTATLGHVIITVGEP